MGLPLRDTLRHTYGDYLAWPEDMRYELIDGIAYAMAPAPLRLHQEVLLEIARQTANALEGKPCRPFVAPFDVRLPRADEADRDIDTVVQPDLVVVCDRGKLDEYFASVRDLEMRLAVQPAAGGGAMCSPGAAPQAPADYRARARAMLDVIALAFQCDMTRVITFMLGAWESEYVFDFLSVRGDHHGVSHHGGNAGNFRDLEAIDRWEVEQFAYLASRLGT